MDAVVEFIRSNVPAWPTVLMFGPVALAWATFTLLVAGWLKRRKQWRTGYTRKVFHFATFGSAVGIQLIWGMPAMCLYGGMTSLVILYAIIRGDGNMLFEAMARETDRPHATRFIVVPYFATLIGGVLTHIWFGPPFAVAGMLVTGVADALAEPIGTRFGKHQYHVFTFTKTQSVRSLEGSTAVLIASMVSLVVAVHLHPEIQLSLAGVGIICGIAVLCMLTEAASPHGWDNLTLQLLPSWLIWSWL